MGQQAKLKQARREGAVENGVVQVVITFNPQTGAIDLRGPTNNGVMLLGLLEMAKVAFIQQAAKVTDASRVTVPKMVLGRPS